MGGWLELADVRGPATPPAAPAGVVTTRGGLAVGAVLEPVGLLLVAVLGGTTGVAELVGTFVPVGTPGSVGWPPSVDWPPPPGPTRVVLTGGGMTGDVAVDDEVTVGTGDELVGEHVGEPVCNVVCDPVGELLGWCRLWWLRWWCPSLSGLRELLVWWASLG
jgi:hypothetical protein